MFAAVCDSSCELSRLCLMTIIRGRGKYKIFILPLLLFSRTCSLSFRKKPEKHPHATLY